MVLASFINQQCNQHCNNINNINQDEQKMAGSWTLEDDLSLWSLRSSRSTAQLAAAFGKSPGAIRSRLKHLQDPTHKAYRRRIASAPPSRRTASSSAATSKQENVVDLTDDSSLYAARSGRPPSASSNSHLQSITQPGTKPPIAEPSSSLNADQTAAASRIFSGSNAFLTGAAGVGKSYLLNYLIRSLKDRRGTDKVAVAAATGIASTHIGGVTIHSWAGVRLGVGGPRVLVPRVLENKAACDRWRKAEVLILDEVSMIDGMFFEALDQIGREVRGQRHRPFGGIQLVLSGDFFQLPPVSLARCGFAFESPAWNNGAIKMVELRQVVRQSGDTTFIHLLNQVRIGTCTAQTTQALEACHVSKKPVPTDGIVPTKLYCTNRNVDAENERNLAALKGREMTFNATDKFKGNYGRDVQKNISEAMNKKMPAQLRLKIGAQVILTRNMPDKNLVNGSRGIVKAFKEANVFDDEDEHMSYKQQYKGKQDTKVFPMVHFSNGVQMLVREESVFQGGSSGAMTRSQLPLKLAWSLTVHKSQGMTVERAELQLEDAFDYGQVYVALSRITSLDGLWVRGGSITQSVVKAHPKVKSFYEKNGSSVTTPV